MSKEHIGIALGGGGARGYAHLGVMQALNEKDIYPDSISGTSAGSMIGVCLAAGLSPKDILDKTKDNTFGDFAKLTIPDGGLLSLENLRNQLKELIDVDKIEDLPIPFFAAATNLNTGQVVYLNEGSLIDCVQASSSIPVLFSPVKLGDQYYVDGGLVDNLPLAPLMAKSTKTIAVSISPIEKQEELGNVVQIAARTFQIGVNSKTSEVKESCDVFIEPDGIRKFDLLDTSSAEELFELGYEFTKKMDIDL